MITSLEKPFLTVGIIVSRLDRSFPQFVPKVQITCKPVLSFSCAAHCICICNIQGDQKVSVHLTITVHTTDELKMAITEYIRSADRDILNTVFENTFQHVIKCLEICGGHFQHSVL